MLAYPTLLTRLMDRCSVEPSADIGRNTFFIETHRDGAGCRQLCDVYAYRMCDVWKTPQVIEWLADQTATKILAGVTDEYAKRWKSE